MKARVWMIGLISLVWGLATTAGATDITAIMAQKFKAGQKVPLASSIYKTLDDAQAYALQKGYLAKLGDTIIGHKAGLTSKPAQDKFKAPGPARGCLTRSMEFKGGVVDGKHYSKMFLEVEIGYVLARDIKAPVKAASAPGLVARVLPVVEVPDINFATMKGLTFQDLVAANVGARGFVTGAARLKPDQVDVNKVTGQLFKDGKSLGPPAPGTACLGNQWEALAWTINNALTHKAPLKKGMLIITGSMGKMYPGGPGLYKAVYTGGLGEVSFRVK